MPTLPAWARRLLAAAPLLLITGLSLVLLWPVPTGQMPLSADHTVHLTRIWMWAEQLASGQVRGWDSTWFFGTPVGELYPVLGDLIIVAVRALSLGLLDWPQAYAVGFSLVFTIQGWALLRVGRALGLGPVVGLVAAALMLADVGAYREGGWAYTVFYGVWPQALSTALTWLGLGELCVACQASDPIERRRTIATAALAMGAALLAHPMAMLSFAIGGPLLVLTLGVGSRQALRRTIAVALITAALAIVLAGWWLWPMLAHRGFMASYGWMWLPLSRMAAMAAEGQWVQGMPSAVGMVVSLGFIVVAIMGSRTARFVAAFALICWLLASRDALWGLRLDLLSEGFTHLQYQRFLITAKPGFLLVAGATVGIVLRGATWAWQWSSRSRGRPLAAALTATAIGLCGYMFVQQREAAKAQTVLGHVGQIQAHRIPDQPAFDADYAALVEWMRAQEPGQRATVLAPRNLHWFMDAPALAGSGMGLYKQGFTPGDNFVHKPEAGSTELLDALRVRYVITRGRRGSRRSTEVARFGSIRVLERQGAAELPLAWLQGPGELEILEDAVDQGLVRVRVSGASEGTRVVFGIAGFPRWELEHEGTPIEWFEVPVVGDGPAVTIAQRNAGELRGGKANGDDGSEPTLMAARVTDGELTLRYHARTASDVLTGVLSLLSLVICGVLLWRPTTFTAPTRVLDTIIARLGPLAHPIVVGGLIIVLAIGAMLRIRGGAEAERGQAFAWLDAAQADPGRYTHAGMFKTDMLIQPAVLVSPRHKAPAQVTFPSVQLHETLHGWVAIDDDAAKNQRRGRHHLRVEALGTDGTTTTLLDTAVAHRPGRRLLTLDTSALAGTRADLRVTVESSGKSPPPVAFDFDLGAPQ